MKWFKDNMANDNSKDKPDAPPEESPQGEGMSETEKLAQELVETKDKYLRLFAEFDNVRKRNERERQELIKYAHEEVIIELLGFYEDFERCVEAARKKPGDGAALLKGVEMTLKRMRDLLKKYDVKPIDALGKKFDPDLHEALATAESEEHEDGTVIEVFQTGYMLGDRVARTAKVKVSKRTEKTNQQGAGSGEQGNEEK
jgi:molecular chaperone GrpE